MAGDKSTTVSVRLADLEDASDERYVVDLLDMYACDPMGQAAPLPAVVRSSLVPGLRRHPRCCVFLAFHEEEAVGIAVCFEAFSTFRAKPLLNIHDIAVCPDARGRGVGRALLAAVERDAATRGCCKITLEVRSDNPSAKGLYSSFGFAGGERESAYLFWSKPLE